MKTDYSQYLSKQIKLNETMLLKMEEIETKMIEIKTLENEIETLKNKVEENEIELFRKYKPNCLFIIENREKYINN